MNPSLILGVDGGGTSTTAWLADREGTVLGRGVAGPSNIKAIGESAARAGLEGSIRLAFADAGLELTPVAVACLGLAGFDRPEDRERLRRWVEGSPWSGRLILVNDGDLVLAAGTPEGWGVGLISGTGSIAVGRDRDGRTTRAGGWGPLIGDEGSAYAVVLSALRLVARRADGREPSENPALTRAICSALGIESTAGMIASIYRNGVDRAQLAGLAPLVVAAAEQDPWIDERILKPAGHELAVLVDTVARGLDFPRQVLPLAMAGSFLLNCSRVAQVMFEELSTLGYEVRAFSVAEPVEGALILASQGLVR